MGKTGTAKIEKGALVRVYGGVGSHEGCDRMAWGDLARVISIQDSLLPRMCTASVKFMKTDRSKFLQGLTVEVHVKQCRIFKEKSA